MDSGAATDHALLLLSTAGLGAGGGATSDAVRPRKRRRQRPRLSCAGESSFLLRYAASIQSFEGRRSELIGGSQNVVG